LNLVIEGNQVALGSGIQTGNKCKDEQARTEAEARSFHFAHESAHSSLGSREHQYRILWLRIQQGGTLDRSAPLSAAR